MKLAHLAVVLSGLSFAASSAAQCPPFWAPGGPEPLLTGNAGCSTLWDPDGAGPLPTRLVIGGSNLSAGTEPAGNRVMTWDGSSWSSLGTGPATTGAVRLLTTWNGQLVAAGGELMGTPYFIAVWNGAGWQSLPAAGVPHQLSCVAEWNGKLVAGGSGVTGGVSYPILNQWNGSSWSPLPAPPLLQWPEALISYQGLLCVGGGRVLLSPVSIQGVVERWNGSSWATSTTAIERISAFAVRFSTILFGTDTLFACGQFTSIGGTTADHVAATSGGSTFAWSAVGSAWPAGMYPSRLHVRNTGPIQSNVVASGFTTGPNNVLQSAAGGAWTPMGANLTSVTYYNGAYHGTQATSGGSTACVRYDGSAWNPVRGPGLDAEVRASTPTGNEVILGGTFTTIGGLALNRVARWDGTTFQALGTGIAGASIDAMTTMNATDVVAGGAFTAAGGVSASNIARWNGSAWSALGTGTDQPVLALARMPNGDVIAGGKFTTAGGVACARIARWNGSAWSPLGSGMNGDVHALAVRADGRVFAGGVFTTAGGASCNRVAQWNGFAWLPLGAGTDASVLGLAVRANDDVVAVGAFTTAGGAPASRCARWTGTAWAAMGTASADPSPVRAAVALPNGDIVVGHGFHTPTNNPDEGISRWDGSTWTGFDTGLGSGTSGAVTVNALTLRANGDLVVGGLFARSGNLTAKNLARLAASCPASATAFGAGCSSTAGPLVLGADSLPWISAPFRTTTTGVAPGSLCLATIGLTQLSIPLSALLGEGQPGCSLLTTLDILLFAANGPGNTASTSFLFSNDPALIGVPFFQQTLPLEFDGSGALAAVRGSNALAATIGTL